MTFHVPEKYRLRSGPLGTDQDNGNNGAFFIPTRPGQPPLKVIATDGAGWEHVSVSLPNRCPTWEEMCHIKSMFWDDEDAAMQLHHPRSDWVNNHRYCLHLWRPMNGASIPLPDSLLVGYKDLGVLA